MLASIKSHFPAELLGRSKITLDYQIPPPLVAQVKFYVTGAASECSYATEAAGGGGRWFANELMAQKDTVGQGEHLDQSSLSLQTGCWREAWSALSLLCPLSLTSSGLIGQA